jgi:putative transposase
MSRGSRSISRSEASRVASVLERLYATRGLPKTIVLDNGPEFTGQALDAWAHRRGVQLQFIRPGKPVENASRVRP